MSKAQSSTANSGGDWRSLNVSKAVEKGLEASSYDEPGDLIDVDPRSLEAELNASLDAAANPVDIESTFSHLSPKEARFLEDEGFTTIRAVAQIDVGSLARSNANIGKQRLRRAKQHAEQQVEIIDTATAQSLIERAETAQPVTPFNATQALSPWPDAGPGEATVTDASSHDSIVSEPVASERDYMAGADPADEPDAFYRTVKDDTETGLPILDNRDFENVPVPENHPEADSRPTIPVDENGDVIPPAIPDGEMCGRPLDEMVPKKLAKRKPVCLQGERGCGKNYLLKWIAYATARGYVGVDCAKDTMPHDLFGIKTAGDDGIVIENGPVKEGLLGPNLVVLNEFPVMPAGSAMALHQFLNEGKLMVKSHGQLIEPHPGARIVITMNPPTIEYKDSEPMNDATKGRFRAFKYPYPDSVDDEAESLRRQINDGQTFVTEDTVKKVVEFAHKSREDQHSDWPTLSVRNVKVILEDIADGVPVRNAIEKELWWMAGRNMEASAADDKLDSMFGK